MTYALLFDIIITVEREWRNRQTRTFEGRVGRLVRVQVPSLAPRKKRLSQIGNTKSGSPVFKCFVRKKKNRRQVLTAESIAMQGSVKNRPLLLNILFVFSGYAIIFSNKECPKRLELILLQSFSTLYAKLMRKNCVSVFGFPLVKNLLKRKSCLITPNAPST